MTSNTKEFSEFFSLNDERKFNGGDNKIEQSNFKGPNNIKSKHIFQKDLDKKTDKENLNNFLPNFIINDLNKDSDDLTIKNQNNFNNQNFFFEDFDDDYEDEKQDNNKLYIMNTIKNMKNLDDSSNFENFNFNKIYDENQNFSDPYDAIFSNYFQNYENEIDLNTFKSNVELSSNQESRSNVPNENIQSTNLYNSSKTMNNYNNKRSKDNSNKIYNNSFDNKMNYHNQKVQKNTYNSNHNSINMSNNHNNCNQINQGFYSNYNSPMSSNKQKINYILNNQNGFINQNNSNINIRNINTQHFQYNEMQNLQNQNIDNFYNKNNKSNHINNQVFQNLNFDRLDNNQSLVSDSQNNFQQFYPQNHFSQIYNHNSNMNNNFFNGNSPIFVDSYNNGVKYQMLKNLSKNFQIEKNGNVNMNQYNSNLNNLNNSGQFSSKSNFNQLTSYSENSNYLENNSQKKTIRQSGFNPYFYSNNKKMDKDFEKYDQKNDIDNNHLTNNSTNNILNNCNINMINYPHNLNNLSKKNNLNLDFTNDIFADGIISGIKKYNKNKNKIKKNNVENNLCRSFQSAGNNNNGKEIFNNIINIGSSRGSLFSGYSENNNEIAYLSASNLEDSLKSLDINSQSNKFGYSSEALDNSKDSSFSSDRKQNKSDNAFNQNNNKKSLFNKDKKESIKETKEDLISFIENLTVGLDVYICSQKGSRVLQKYLDKITPEILNYLIKKISRKFSLLMMDTYGNYFCQKLIQSCSSEQRVQILNYISNDIVNISYHTCGTHALQSFLELINLSQEENIILESVQKDLIKMCYDNNSTHVIQKILLCIDESKRISMNELVIENIKCLVLDSNGICVIKKLINSNKCEKSKKLMFDKIKSNCLEIIQSPFGNYAIQYIIEQWGYEYCKELIEIIINNIISLSMQKFSSNVVEKIIESLDVEMKKKVINGLFNPTKIMGFLKNKYGSFVLQRIIKLMTEEERIEMKAFLSNKITVTSTKEKSRLNNFLDILHS